MQKIARPYCSISIGEDSGLDPVRTVLVGREAGSGETVIEAVLLRALTGCRVYLAALVDRDEVVREWLEWWVQSPVELADTPLARAGVVANAMLDQQWSRQHAALRRLAPGDRLETGWEQQPAYALVIDTRSRRLTRLVHASTRAPVEICRDDAVLKTASLGVYSTTLERWFRCVAANGEVSWLSAQDLNPSATADRVAVAESKGDAPLAEFNSAAGLMELRRHHPLSLETYLTWLDRLAAGDSTVAPVAGPGFVRNAGEENDAPLPENVINDDRPISASRGIMPSDGAALESALLRLLAWQSMARELHEACTRLGQPFLNLSIDSYRIALPARATAMPPAWLASAVLVQGGDSVPIRLGDRIVGFAPAGGSLSTPHALPKFGGCQEGGGTLRIRQAADAGAGRVKLDGVLDGNEIRNAEAGDFVWLSIQVEGRTLSFLGRIENETSGTRAGTPFSATAEIPAAAVTRMKAAARHPCQYVLYRPVSAVFDVFSLGVIGLRLFVATERAALADLVDDVFELATLAPRAEGVAGLGRLAANSDVGERCRALLVPPAWAKREGGVALPDLVWLAIVHELIEFIAAEAPALDNDSASEKEDAGLTWLDTLSQRLAALEQLTADVRGLVLSPRADHDEVARIVHSFV